MIDPERQRTRGARPLAHRSRLQCSVRVAFGARRLCPRPRDKALNEYEAKFGDFLYRKYSALVENYGVVRFHAINAERVGLRDALVHLIIYRKGDAVDTEWRVRMFEGEPRIIDVEIAGVSLTKASARTLRRLSSNPASRACSMR